MDNFKKKYVPIIKRNAPIFCLTFAYVTSFGAILLISVIAQYTLLKEVFVAVFVMHSIAGKTHFY